MNIEIRTFEPPESFKPFEVVLRFNTEKEVGDYIRDLHMQVVSYREIDTTEDFYSPVNQITAAIKRHLEGI